MAVELPDWPAPASAVPGLVDFGATLRPPTGGATQRHNRLGNRFRLSVTMPAMKYKTGRLWVARLIRAQTEGARMEWPQQGFDPGTPGAVAVDGSGQAGALLAVRGAEPGYAFREGQFFSILTGGRPHVTMVAAEVLAGSDGKALLPVAPMLRVPHLDGDPCEFGRPIIEGAVIGEDREWQLALAGFMAIEFAIEERV